MTTLLQEFEEWLKGARIYEDSVNALVEDGLKKLEELKEKYRIGKTTIPT